MKRCARVLVVAWLASACPSEPSDSGAKPASKADVKPASKADAKPSKIDEGKPPSKVDEEQPAEPVAKRPEPGPPGKGELWRMTVEDAKAAGLPPVAFSFQTTGSGMSGGGPSDGDYITLSGPPGGPLMLRITPATAGADPATLVRRESATVTAEEVELLGAKRRAVVWIAGESPGRTSWCGIVVAPPGAAEGAPALLIELGVGHDGPEVTCKTTLEDDVLGPVIKSFVFE